MTIHDATIIAILFGADLFFAGFMAHALWDDFVNRKAMRDAAADAFFDATFANTNAQMGDVQ